MERGIWTFTACRNEAGKRIGGSDGTENTACPTCSLSGTDNNSYQIPEGARRLAAAWVAYGCDSFGRSVTAAWWALSQITQNRKVETRKALTFQDPIFGFCLKKA